MRYYKIDIDGGTIFQSYATSNSRGSSLPGALQVELDIPVAAYAAPAGDAFVRIWGIPLADISQAKDLNGKNIKIYGGFQKGLPLANPAQSGLLVQGYIFQAFGNWIGTNMSLDLYIVPGNAPGTGTALDAPKNLPLQFKKGQAMGQAISNALTTGFPGFTINMNIDSNLVLQQDENSFYSGLIPFSQYIYQLSKAIIGGTTYQGVSITLDQTTFNVFDGSKAATQTKIVAFNDLIGQPTWIRAPSIQFKCAMRADLKIGDEVIMPKTLTTNSAQAQTSLVNQRAAFQGKFQISSVRHVGNFRQPDAASWVSVFDAFPLTSASGVAA